LSSNSSYFRHYFNWYDKEVLILPFVAQSRFQNNIAFEKRINKVLSTGTNTQKMKEDDFISFFHTDILQPMRSEIIENIDLLKNYIDPMINNLQSSNITIIHKEKSNLSKFKYFLFSDLARLIKLILKGFFNIKLDNLKNDSNYYKVDIVEKYNSYKMFIVPEEIIGVPGIGFIEGMNCGCAYIGVDGPMYNDLGMIAGTHFISYDGTMDDLKTKIDYYQKNEKVLEKIAMNGYQFAKNNFDPNKIANSFFKRLSSKVLN
jgi:glycosyltransferase involved in cell wall biosynthesis